MRAKLKAWNQYKITRNDDTYKNYTDKRNKENRENKRAQKEFEKHLAKNVKSNSKSFFAYIRNKQRTRDKVGPLKDEDGIPIVDDEKGANFLNNYFGSVFTTENLDNIPEPKQIFQGAEQERLGNINFTEHDVLKKLENLKVDKSPGGDNIHPKFLYELRENLKGSIVNLYNRSISTGEVPRD